MTRLLAILLVLGLALPARAEVGEVISVAVVADLKGEGIEVDSSKHESLCERLGRLRLLEQQLIDGARR